MTRVLAGCVLLAACGAVSSSTDTPTVDAAAVDAIVEIDAALPADGAPPRCAPTDPFGAPVPLPTLNSDEFDGAPFLTADERTVYFASRRPGGPGGYDIYVATRSTSTEAFERPALLNGVNSAADESRPVLTADGLTLYAEVNRGNVWHVEVATRTTTDQPFGASTPVTALNAEAGEAAPFVLPDHRAIYLASSKDGNGALYRAERTGESWTEPQQVIGIDLQSTASEDYPAVSSDERTLLFMSSRPGGTGGRDMYIATRANLTQGFAAPVELAGLNTAADEQPGWLSPDGCALYYASNGDLFVAIREP